METIVTAHNRHGILIFHDHIIIHPQGNNISCSNNLEGNMIAAIIGDFFQQVLIIAVLPQLDFFFGNTNSVTNEEIGTQNLVVSFTAIGQMVSPENHASLPAFTALSNVHIRTYVNIGPLFSTTDLIIRTHILNRQGVTSTAVMGSNADSFGANPIRLQNMTACFHVAAIEGYTVFLIHAIGHQCIPVYKDLSGAIFASQCK